MPSEKSDMAQLVLSLSARGIRRSDAYYIARIKELEIVRNVDKKRAEIVAFLRVLEDLAAYAAEIPECASCSAGLAVPIYRRRKRDNAE